MRVPLSWLREYVELPADTGELVDRLTVAGLEASGVEHFGSAASPLPWDADKIVVAKVLRIEKHPDADKLKMVTVDYGAAEPKTVITGAPNIAPGESGMKVVLGLKGSRYHYTDKEGKKAIFTLEAKALRGIMNDAMCMSDYELGISDDHDGIIILDESDAEPGTPVTQVLGETVVDLDILPNMARCLGLLGLAREVSAVTRKPVTVPAGVELKPAGADAPVAIRIADPKLCARYAGIVLANVTVGPAPRVMRSRLRSAGMRPISNIVDVTNYVMLETGRPLHAFDFDVLKQRAGGKTPTIAVRPAAAGETLVTLDGIARELTSETLVIADDVGPIALAGVMGGRDTEVTATTKAILLEAADFDFVSIRKTARKFNLFSEASTRFSRGIHPETVAPAVKRAVELLQRHAGATVVGGLVDVYPAPLPVQTVNLTRSEIERVLGRLPSNEEIVPVLEALEFKLADTLWGWTVTVPPTRLDVQAGAADLIEEIARIHGYDRLPCRLLPLELPPQSGNETLAAESKLQDELVALGLQEVIQYSLSSEAAEAGYADGLGEPVKLLNPISPERGILRRTLLPGLVEVAARNLKEQPGVALFELGPVYRKNGNHLPDEPKKLGILLAGRRSIAAWDDPLAVKPPAYDFYDLKGIVEALLPTGATFEVAKDHPAFHPGRTARIRVGDTLVGIVGELHPKLLMPLKLGDKTLIAAELDVALLTQGKAGKFRPISSFPKALRDLAVVVADDVPASTVLAELKAAGAELLEAAELFDVYRGESIPPGTKSLAYALTYRTVDKPLSDKEVDKVHSKIEGRLKQVLGATIRGK